MEHPARSLPHGAAALFALAGTLAACATAWGACPTADCDPALLARRTLHAVRFVGPPPAIDGRLDDAAWTAAPAATDFVESRPRPGAPAALRSEARVVVDDQALYVALRYDDPDPARIVAPLARRDDETTSDWAFVEIDSRHDRRSGFSFGVNPRGVQVDGLWLDDATYDSSWNAVWESAARVDANGWTAEFRIPFSQLAFRLPAAGGEIVWGINFYRYNATRGAASNWSPRYQGLAGVVSNFNDLVLPAPAHVARGEITPYLAPRAGNDAPPGTHVTAHAGADLKLGLGPSASLAATLFPDFGQVEADPDQVNLTAFELFQPERRPFFLEGLDLFRFDTSLPFSARDISFADESPFYSRRVGPLAHGETTLRAAAKLTGETASGWLTGAFGAFSDEARPTGTAVARAVKALHGGESSVGFFAADVHRAGTDVVAATPDDAVVAGAEVLHRFGGKQYETRAWLLASRVSGSESAIRAIADAPHHLLQRPDRGAAGPYGEALAGVSGEARLSRVGGAFRWDLALRGVSPGFDVDEIGYQRSSDWMLATAAWRYERFTPGRRVRAWAVGSTSLGAGWTWAGERRAAVVDAFGSLDFANYWSVKLTARRDLPSLSIDRMRGGPALLLPARDAVALSLVTDQRRPSYATLDTAASREPGSGSWSASAAPLLNLRSADWLQWSIGASWQTDTVGWQYVGRVGTPAETVVARVRQHTLAATLRADLTFTPRLALQLYVAPFGTVGRYDRYQRLAAARAPDPAARFRSVSVRSGADPATLDVLGDDGAAEGRLGAPDARQRSLNGSLVLRWEYRPGSFLTAVWNQQRAARSADASGTATAALGGVFRERPNNVVLVKTSFRIG